MPSIDFNRTTVELVIERATSRLIRIGLADSPARAQIELSAESVCSWVRANVPDQVLQPVLPYPVHRLTLDIRTLELHAEDWEGWMRQAALALHFTTIVRTTRVPARVAQLDFTPPLRLLLCGRKDANTDLDEILYVFGQRSPEKDVVVARAYVGKAAPLGTLGETEHAPFDWPVVDILHLCKLPAKNQREQLSPSALDYGSVGWIMRRLDAWQTRLLVLEVSDEKQKRLARRVAAALVARGGPGVILYNPVGPLPFLYDPVIHDFPLDTLSDLRSPQPGIAECLFAGAEREELARVSATVRKLAELNEAMGRSIARGPTAYAATSSRALTDVERRWAFEPTIRQQIARVAGEASQWHYEHRERDGFLPMSAALVDVRAIAAPFIDKVTKESAKPTSRFVNGSLWERHEKSNRRIDAEKERLVLGEPCYLRLQIGDRDQAMPAYQASVFKEFPKLPGRSGSWLEVAVNGVGFDIDGASVQELWVPHDGETDQIWFAVTPTREGAAVLRYTFYYRQNVLQSFRLAAIVSSEPPKRRAATPQELTMLAAALHVPTKDFPRATYLNRLEYAAADLTSAAQMPERRVSIVANDVAGERVVTIKGKRYFFDSKAGAVNSYAARLRETLFDASVAKIGPKREEWPYRFGDDAALNLPNLEKVLPDLARAGWQLYADVFAQDARTLLAPDLEGTDATIAVAHALLEDVIPWAAMYDRKYAGPPSTGASGVCTACIPKSDGKLSAIECGSSPDCLLNHGMKPWNVACPLRFWGFRHLIEIPPKQVTGGEQPKPTVQISGIVIASPSTPPASVSSLRLTALVNADLATAPAHAIKLQALTSSRLSKTLQKRVETEPDAVMGAAGATDLDVLYFFCHARGAPDCAPAVVEFGAGGKTARYTSDLFDMVWSRKPLIVLNGCSTAAFTPAELSPFVKTFTRDGKAGGVVGTEIPVHETLASDVACQLLQRVLDGERVGTALLAVRRSLLSKNNPLGLAYTLFASLELEVGESPTSGPAQPSQHV